MADNSKEYTKITDFLNEKVKDSDGKLAKITQIHPSYIEIVMDNGGATYQFKTGTASKDNAIAKGVLVFINEELTPKFIDIYEAYILSEEGLQANWLYWFNRD